MPQIRYTKSLLGLSIKNEVKQFILDNANNLKNDKEITTEQSAEMLSDAICFAISKALSSKSVSAAFAVGLGPQSAGALIYTTPAVGLQFQTIEL